MTRPEMSGAKPAAEVRTAGPEDAGALGGLLHRFNTEYDDASPGPEAMAERCGELLAAGEMAAFLAGDDLGGPDGLAVVRFRPALWSGGNEAYLEELYVVPDRRGEGLGRALMDAVIALARERGCDRLDLGTGEGDAAARSLYESLGFSNDEGDGTRMLFYELEL